MNISYVHNKSIRSLIVEQLEDEEDDDMDAIFGTPDDTSSRVCLLYTSPSPRD